ncbi:MAG: hypothetical protein IT447_14475 [Phycisphaerales bacterium]|nr:hypothetical protein [Phycisphaerales bacterium]
MGAVPDAGRGRRQIADDAAPQVLLTQRSRSASPCATGSFEKIVEHVGVQLAYALPTVWMAALTLCSLVAMLLLVWSAQRRPSDSTTAPVLRPLPVLIPVHGAKVRPLAWPQSAIPCRAPPICPQATQLESIPPRRG